MAQKWAYYNEIDPYAAQWLRNLIAAGHIAPGEVDERSIEDVHPEDVKSFCQQHYFAGIGVWSAALRRVGWGDDRPVWTGSCPCQPFSAAGKGMGFADERHLWPAFFHLITQCRPDRVYGEQVSDRGGIAWLDLVSADMEAAGYAFGAIVSPVASVGAPHRRHRTDWMADATHGRRGIQWREALAPSVRHLDGSDTSFIGLANPQGFGSGTGFRHSESSGERCAIVANDGASHRVAHARGEGLSQLVGGRFEPTGLAVASPASWLGEPSEPRPQGVADGRSDVRGPGGPTAQRAGGEPIGRVETSRLGHTDSDQQWGRRDARTEARPRPVLGHVDGFLEAVGLADSGDGQFSVALGRPKERNGHGPISAYERPGPVNGFWRNADWLYCRDDKWRPVESGSSPLAHGASARMGRLRAYGNAVNLEKTAAFIWSTL